MEFILDLPWPWSMSPVVVLQALSGGNLPSWMARDVVAVLAALLANLSLGGSGIFGLLLRIPLTLLGLGARNGEAPKPVRGALLSVAVGLLG